MIENMAAHLIKSVLKLIKKNIIEKNLVKIMNEKLGEVFHNLNDIILNKVEPEELNILIDESKRSNLMNSSIIGSISYILNSLIGVNGSLNFNDLVNIFTYNSGIFNLKSIYEKDLEFQLNFSKKNNISFGNLLIILDDLNISGLNTWKKINVLEPELPLILSSFLNLENLTINASFSLRVELNNNSNIVEKETILLENSKFGINTNNNSLTAFLQLPFNKKRAIEYSNYECLNFDCALDLVDSNGTGITSLSLNENFGYFYFELKGGDDLEEFIMSFGNFFINNFNNQINLLINALFNRTLINIVNEKLNEFLYPKSCPGIPDPDDGEVAVDYTSAAFATAFIIFILIILFPYILGKARKNKKKENFNNELNENNSNEIVDKSDKNNDEASYCIQNIKIKWIKELGRTDPEGASLFLDSRVPLVFRILIPIAILSTMAVFVSSNSSAGAYVLIVLNLGRRIQTPSLLDFSLVNSVREMWNAEAYFLSGLVAVFTGFWPYCKLFLMIISFCLPTSILSHRNRGKILILLDATGKYSFLDSYVMIMMIVAFHFHVDLPISEKSVADKGILVDVYTYPAFGFPLLIAGTLISLILSHILNHIHRHLEEHPDQNKGEKAESYKSVMSFAKNKYIKDKPFRILISISVFVTFGLIILGSFTRSFSFYFHGLAAYALDLLNIPHHREYNLIDLGLSVPGAAENSNSGVIIFTQIIYFLTVLIIPFTFCINLIILWFIPMTRKAQKIFYTIAEILNAWSSIDVFVVAIFAALLEVAQIAKFLVGDKCILIDPILEKYFNETLEGHSTFFKVQTYRRLFIIFCCSC